MNVLLDLDGTLTDPREGITRCIQYALERLGRPIPRQEDLLDCIGPPLHSSFVDLLEGDHGQARRAVSFYRERFGDVGLYENEIYDGILEALDALRDDSARLYVATSKPTVYARRITAHFGIDARLDGVFGSELDGTRADKRDLLAHIVRALHLEPTETVMVGDRMHDMIGARGNCIRPVGVAWGYGAIAELLEAGAEHLLASPEELALLRSTCPNA